MYSCTFFKSCFNTVSIAYRVRSVCFISKPSSRRGVRSNCFQQCTTSFFMLLRLTFLMFRSGRDRTQNQAGGEDCRKTVATGVDEVTKRRLKSREKMRVIKKLDPRGEEGVFVGSETKPNTTVTCSVRIMDANKTN